MSRDIKTEVLQVADIGVDPRFQPRSESGVSVEELKRMQAAGQASGHENGWAPELYDPIRVAHLGGKLWVLEGFHRLALGKLCGLTELECRVHYGFAVEEIEALARRSNLKTRPQEPLEEAAIYAAELEGGASAESISARYDRRPTAYYLRRACLNYLCEELKTSVRDRHLKIDYGEVIGKLAKAGASRTFQIYLRELAWKSKVRVEVFRGLGEALLSRSSGKSGSTGLFDMAGDAAVQAAQTELRKVTATLELRSMWNDVRASGGKVLRRLRSLGQAEPIEVKQGIELARLEMGKIDLQFGVALSSSTEEMIADALGGVGSVEVVAKPLVRWEGDKSWLLPYLVPMVRRALEKGGRLIEPFAGGAALTLAVGPEHGGVLVDCVPEVLDLHDASRDWSGALASALGKLIAHGESERDYRAIADADWSEWDCVRVGAALIYLNRLALGGVWRVNRDGRSLVPFVGRKEEDSWPTGLDFEAVAGALRTVECRHEHGALAIRSAQANDVIYADPPVAGWEYGRFDPRFELDLEALALDLHEARKRGAVTIVSTQWSKQSERLYGTWSECKKVGRPRGQGRTSKEEALYAGGISFEETRGLW